LVQRKVDVREIGPVPVALEDQLPFVQADADPLPRDAGHLGGQENGGLGQDYVDERIPRPDLLALKGGPRGLQPCLAGAGRESVDEGFTEDAELPLERILQHAVKRAPALLEFVLYAHGGIFAFLHDCLRSCFPASAHEEQMRSRFHIVFERGRIFLWKPSATDVTMSTVASAGRVPSSRRRGGRRG